ncbi:MAG: hypothetical protein IKX39_06920 [Muribaculaceae bacterium]|nr:hypothetical protein [Muribaculaceae bacterium]
MKKSLLALFALALLLGSCSEGPTQAGKQLAQEFFAAWGDTVALKQVEQHYKAVEDSLWMPNSGMYLKKAFLETTAKNDSMRAVAQLMVYDIDNYAELQAFRIFGQRVDEHFNVDSAKHFLTLIDWSGEFMRKPDFAAAAKEEVDRQVRELSVDKQMRIYAAVATPTMLGLELKADREAPNADLELIDRQVKELEKIYTPQQMQEFNKAFSSNE